MATLKILMVFEVYRPIRGGIQTWISEVIPRLHDHQVTLLTSKLDGEIQSDDGLDIRRIGLDGVFPALFGRGYFSLFRSLWVAQAATWIRKHIAEYDAVYAHVQASEMAGMLGAYPLRPVIWHYHGTNHEVLYELFNVGKAVSYELFEHVGAILPFTYCVTCDDYTRHMMIDHFGVTKRRVVTIRNGIDSTRFHPIGNEPVDGSILSVRRLVYKNGLQYLIPAMKAVIRHHPKAVLQIAGGGPMKNELMDLVDRLGLADSVKFLGQVPDNELVPLYNQAEVVVLPSMIEGTPIGCLEAMACGRPVLATAVGGVPETVTPETGFLVSFRPDESFVEELAAKLSFILDNRELATMIGLAARKRVESQFTWDKTAHEVSKLLKGVAG
jgi:glycosyltransferase involved in cell wall biosynthesis